MISRRRCKEIALQWVTRLGVEEWAYRMRLIAKSDRAFTRQARSLGVEFKPDRSKLVKEATEAVLMGYYDPPMPKIPNLFQRLRMNDWTPPMPTKSQWPMGHGLSE